jgi:DNA repair protein RadA/Sms
MAATDVYIKVAGGVFLKDPSVDLSIVASILSSYHDIPLPRDTVFIGELGLSGEIRPVPMMDIRLKEADKLGYKRVLLSGLPLGYEMPQCNLKLVRLNSIEELAKRILEGDF